MKKGLSIRLYAWELHGQLCRWSAAKDSLQREVAPSPDARLIPVRMIRERDYLKLSKKAKVRSAPQSCHLVDLFEALEEARHRMICGGIDTNMDDALAAARPLIEGIRSGELIHSSVSESEGL